MKVGRRPAEDPRRLSAAREAIGADTELMVDANGAFAPREVIAQARGYAEFGVTWLEEPVTQDDPGGLRAVRRQAPAASAHIGCALERLLHLEYFHDHVRIESMLFDGVLEPVDGALAPDPAVPGHGLSLRREAERYAVA